MTLIVLVAGGPCTGKTTVVEGIARRLTEIGYRVYVIKDWAREIIKREKQRGSNGILPWTNRYLFEELVIKSHLEEYRKLESSGWNYDVILEDGGGYAAKAYCIVDGVDTPPIYNELLKYAEKVDLVLLMGPPRKYSTDSERWESLEYALKIHNAITEVHKEIFRDKIIVLDYEETPEAKVEKALRIIVENLRKQRHDSNQ